MMNFFTGFRYFLVILGISLVVSCDKIPLVKKSKLQQIDTVVDFSSVDLSPSFTECNSIIDKQEKSDCFGRNIHQKIGEVLRKHQLESQYDIEETITVDLLVTSKGEIQFQSTNGSNKIQESLPDLDSVLNLCVKSLPKVLPATKRGIPVTTKYQLPLNN